MRRETALPGPHWQQRRPWAKRRPGSDIPGRERGNSLRVKRRKCLPPWGFLCESRTKPCDRLPPLWPSFRPERPGFNPGRVAACPERSRRGGISTQDQGFLVGETEPGFLHYAPALRAGAPVGMTAGVSQGNPRGRGLLFPPPLQRGRPEKQWVGVRRQTCGAEQAQAGRTPPSTPDKSGATSPAEAGEGYISGGAGPARDFMLDIPVSLPILAVWNIS